MKLTTLIMAVIVKILLVSSFNSFASSDHNHEKEEHHEEAKGPNNGRLLNEKDFSLELVLFERGLPAQYRIYPSHMKKKVMPKDVTVNVKLKRLGGAIDIINFRPEKEYLVGDATIAEPHSFNVEVSAQYQGKKYHWHFDSFEGRTEISKEMAKEMGVITEQVDSQKLTQTLKVYGNLTLAPNAERDIRARFPGVVTKLYVELGQKVNKGQKLLEIESNESLQRYSVNAPISGVITIQNIAEGEQSSDDSLLTITNASELFAELNVYPLDQKKVVIGACTLLSVASSDLRIKGEVFDSLIKVNKQQAKIFRVKVDNSEGELTVGQFVSGDIAVNTFEVPLAVKVNALQSFRDFSVVYEKVGTHYEVRMLKLGRKAGQWIEVISGISVGSEYVTDNSYLIKADIDKAGAAHDH